MPVAKREESQCILVRALCIVMTRCASTHTNPFFIESEHTLAVFAESMPYIHLCVQFLSQHADMIRRRVLTLNNTSRRTRVPCRYIYPLRVDVRVIDDVVIYINDGLCTAASVFTIRNSLSPVCIEHV